MSNLVKLKIMAFLNLTSPFQKSLIISTRGNFVGTMVPKTQSSKLRSQKAHLSASEKKDDMLCGSRDSDHTQSRCESDSAKTSEPQKANWPLLPNPRSNPNLSNASFSCQPNPKMNALGHCLYPTSPGSYLDKTIRSTIVTSKIL